MSPQCPLKLLGDRMCFRTSTEIILYPKRPLDSPGAQELGPTIICHPTLGFLGSFEVTEVPVISLGVTQGQFLLKCNILAAFRGSPDPVSVGRSWSGMNPLEGLHYILVLSAAFRL